MKAWPSRIRNCRGAAALECALGTAALLTISVSALNVYRLADAQATVLHSAVTVADYVSQEETPVAAHIEDLAEFLHGECLAPSDAAFVVSAVGKTGDEDPKVRWASPPHLFGPNAASDTELANCGRVGAAGGAASLPEGFELMDHEAVIMAEVCVRHEGELMYQHHILPIRTADVPSEPV